jgi:hypothetical protein
MTKQIPKSHRCTIRGCKKCAVVEISGYALTKPGWWPVCWDHSRVFAAQRPLKRKCDETPQTAVVKQSFTTHTQRDTDEVI